MPPLEVKQDDAIRTASLAEVRLWTRWEHGNHPVRVYRDDRGTRYEVLADDGPLLYRSARQFIAAQYGRPKSMTHDRYFHTGKYRRRGRWSGSSDLLVLLNQSRPSVTGIAVHGPRPTGFIPEIVTDREASRENDEYRGDSCVNPLFAALKDALPSLASGFLPTPELGREFEQAFGLELDRLEGVVGMDLGARSGRRGARTTADEVRKLLWAGFAGKMLSQGYDPEDVLQEVYRGLQVRNRGKCPWDARKSTFGHYVHMVISCVLTNHHRKEVRRVDRDAVAVDTEDRSWGACPVWVGSDVGDRMALRDLAKYLEDGDQAPEAGLARRILPLVGAGHSRAEIARELEAKPSSVSRALTWLRRKSAEWARAGGMEGHVPERYRRASEDEA